MINLILCSLTVLQNFTLEIQRFSSQRMVQVNFHFLLAHFKHASIETVTFFILHHNYGILINMLMIKMAINAEDFATQFLYQFIVIVTICLIFC